MHVLPSVVENQRGALLRVLFLWRRSVSLGSTDAIMTVLEALAILEAAQEKILSLHLWLRFALLWLVVVVIGFVEGYVRLPFGLAAFLGAVFLTAFVVWRVVPKWLR